MHESSCQREPNTQPASTIVAKSGSVSKNSTVPDAHASEVPTGICPEAFEAELQYLPELEVAAEMEVESLSGGDRDVLQKHSNNKKYHPIGGTIFHHVINFHRLHHYITDLARKYKTYRLITPFRSEVYTVDPVNVEYILKTNFENYGKGEYNNSILKDLLGDGIFTVDGEKWREQRKVSSHEFSTRVLRDYSSVVFRKSAATLARVLSEAANKEESVDMQARFLHKNDSRCGVQSGFCSEMTLRRYVDISWKIKKALNIGSEAKLKKSVKVIDDFVLKLIHTKIEQMHKFQDDSTLGWKKNDILSRFLLLTETNPRYLRDVTLNFMVAGKDTTAISLSWFIYMLCKHPSIQEKVAREIKEVTKVDKITDIEEFAVNMPEEALEKMQYLHAALTETLRLCPVLPVDPKICFSDDTWPDGFNVKKGDMVCYLPYAMGRMKFLWGDDAEEFKPERWLDEKGCFRQENPFKFTAFQAGPRICLGKDFAYRQMKIFSAVLLQCFIFKLKDDKKAVHYKTMINLLIDGGLHVCVSHRSDL
nr:cytochrome P450 family 704 subfamily A polypeptide 1 [Ipomoea batatas]